jgi:hypothetical protein
MLYYKFGPVLTDSFFPLYIILRAPKRRLKSTVVSDRVYNSGSFFVIPRI